MDYDGWKLTAAADAREDAARRDARDRELDDLKDRWPKLTRLVAWKRRHG